MAWAQGALRAQQTWKSTDGPLLEMYVRAVCRARAAHAVLQERGAFVRGAAGVVQHPAVAAAREAEADARAAAEMLLLTPAARRRAGLATAHEVGDLGVVG